MTTTTTIVVNGSLVPVNDQVSASSTPLGAAGVFTSGLFTNANAGGIAGRVESDQGGTLVLQASDGGTTAAVWDTVASHTVVGGTPLEFTDTLAGGVNRYVFTNGATLQTSFRFSAYTTGVRSNV